MRRRGPEREEPKVESAWRARRGVILTGPDISSGDGEPQCRQTRSRPRTLAPAGEMCVSVVA